MMKIEIVKVCCFKGKYKLYMKNEKCVWPLNKNQTKWLFPDFNDQEETANE